jgi:hypothetical protein
MLAKKYTYNFFHLKVCNTFTSDRHYYMGQPLFFENNTYPLYNMDDVAKWLTDFHNAILNDLKEQKLDLEDFSTSARIQSIVKKRTLEALPKMRLQMIAEDGYKLWFTQNASDETELIMDFKTLGQYSPVTKKNSYLYPHRINGIDISSVAPDAWEFHCRLAE